MKKLLLIVLILTLSCNDEEPLSVDTRTECEKALDHIESCVGYRPYIANCNNSRAERILATPCENIEGLWR